jgi:hypothetical protein
MLRWKADSWPAMKEQIIAGPVKRTETANMSDAVEYLHAYAVRAICKARRMPFGRSKRLQRAVGRVYLLLTRKRPLSRTSIISTTSGRPVKLNNQSFRRQIEPPSFRALDQSPLR